ncbi:O-succinylbenzoate synthase [Blattabacterium sp. (Mastotermes darwiniensis) str. MADAR]|uniref:enolase C-terminal domain-like protein n=1 Tax=Blattabacterium sp. (Mastotermes darwiniensis) TaxID=39768 RepID=UPI000231DE52|nr:enolase C-terminal domain-like protein [Blattabacterium sp. (Mastotermes darwiniensis)]AER40646.1 O-succinylbenzoate synthase [Blattabacterium sp. (Mastotermes darwiniensis) str. MADAR]
MTIKSTLRQHKFFFKQEVKNSKRIFRYSIVWFFILKKEDKIGIGECNPLLDVDVSRNLEEYERELRILSKKINTMKKTEFSYYHPYISYSSILFGLEQAFLGLKNNFPILYNSEFIEGKLGIPINSIIWLHSFKKTEIGIKKIEKEISKGFSFIKMKISQKFFSYQYLVLKEIKKKHPHIKIRVDANGTFKKKEEALFCINKLYDINIVHSIEQPIKNGNWKDISKLCKESKLPIALDEELIGIRELKLKKSLLDFIIPKYIVLKPSVCGGFLGSKEWIMEANKRKIGWWISSSLESKIGINAISQWIFKMGKKKDQGIHGLNTGYFYNDFFSPLHIKKGHIWYDPLRIWDLKKII